MIVDIIRKSRLKFYGGAALFSAFCLLIGTAVTGQAATVNNGPAHAPAKLPFGMTAAQYNYQQEQSPLDEAATKIEGLAAKPGAARDGFFDTEVLPPQHTLIVYWHGAMPAAVSHLIAQSQGAIHIRVVQTRYSLAFLTQQQQLAMRVPGVVSSYLQTDGSGMAIGVSAGRLPSAQAGLRTRITVPVTVTSAVTEQPKGCFFNENDTRTNPSRCDDQAPFWGGDVIQTKWTACTGGFGVHNSSGGTYMMTAAHCSWNGSALVNGVEFWNGWATTVLGNSTDVPGPHDGALISTPGGTGALYYDGPGINNGDTANAKSVAGYQTVSVHDSLCESGAFGGVHCGAIVQELGQDLEITLPNNSKITYNGLAVTTSLSGSFVVDGDSGGPWFSLDGATQVWAKGITSGDDSVAKVNLFTPISTLLGTTNTSINKG